MLSADELELFIRANWHYILISGAAAYLIGRKAQQVVADSLKSSKDNSARAAVRNEGKQLEMTPEERVRAAREKQFGLSQDAAARDRTAAEEADRKKLEEQREKLAMRNSGEDGKSGRRLGGDGPRQERQAPQLQRKQNTQESPTAKEEEEGEEEEQEKGAAEETAAAGGGPRLKLPKLPGGDRQSYSAYSGPGDDKGYRPSRYQRNCGPKGG